MKNEKRNTPHFGDDIENGELLSPQNCDKPPFFNNPATIFENIEEIEDFITALPPRA